MSNKLQATEEQLAYARLLDLGMKAGLLILFVTFLIYVSGIMTPHVPVNDVSKYWKLKVTSYLYILSEIEEGRQAEALDLVGKCDAAGHARPAECKEIIEKGHKYIGWTWLHKLGKADFLNFIGIAFLAGVTILCYIRIIPILFRKKDTIYAILAIMEVLVLVLAASGVLKSGGH